MKKKIVAFAVTAAMLVTSAVPVFAVGGWGETTTPVNENPNVVAVDNAGITTESVKGDIDDVVEFQTVVDFNNCKAFANGDKLTLSLVFAQDKKVDLVLTKSNYTGNTASYTAALGEGGSTVSGLSGICGFDWTVDADGISVTIHQYGKAATAAGELTAELPADVTGVLSLHAQASAENNDYIMYVNYPENIKSVQVVGSDGKAASQPVAGESYKIDSVALDYDTVLSAADFDLSEYVNVRWIATKNGTSETLGTGLSYTVEDSDRTKGAVISAVVSYKDGSGIYGSTAWGSDSDPIAVADRLSGNDRYDTAIQVAEEFRNTLSGKRFTAVVVADGNDFADALSGTALADVENAPVLLVNAAHEDEIVDYIEAHMDYSGTVYILGGTSAVSADFERSVEKFNEVRLGGENRYETNIEVLKKIAELDAENSTDVMSEIAVCAGMNYPDALSVSATGMPVLLVGNTITDAQDEYLKQINSINDMYYVIGGTTAVSADLESELRSLDYVNNTAETGNAADVVRIGGSTRYETNEMIVDRFFDGDQDGSAYIAYGLSYADSLTGGALAANMDKPLLLVNRNNTDHAASIIKEKNYDMTVIGGVNAVSAETVQKIYAAAHAA